MPLVTPGTVKSIQEIRTRLTEDLEKIQRESQLADSLWNMQDACRLFLDRYQLLQENVMISPDTDTLVNDFREVFRNELTRLSDRYRVKMRRLIPPPEALQRTGLSPEDVTRIMFTDYLDEIERRHLE